MEEEILDRIIFGNTLQDYCILAALVLLGFIFQKYLSKLLSDFLYRFVEKYAEGISREIFFEKLHRPLAWFVMLVIIYTATSHIEFPQEWNLAPPEKFGLRMILGRLYLIFLIGTITWILLRMVDFIGMILMKKAEKTDSKHDDQLIPFAMEIIKIIVITFAVFFVFGSVFNVNVGSLVAGLGIGGLALAMAAKESLENVLGSFIIFFDKPFVVGDNVTVGNITGTVEKVGFRSTRIRTLEKSFVTIPNRKMIDAELDNLTLRTQRRAKFNICLTYNTSSEKMKLIIADIKNALNNHLQISKESRVNFFDFAESSLTITIEYFVNTMDMEIYNCVREEINFSIMEIIKKHGSDFAFPTRTVLMESATHHNPPEAERI